MKIEIWSDFMCPFCYIGKRKLEIALNSFELQHSAEIEWKSFLLNPNLITGTYKNIYDYLEKEKRIAGNQSKLQTKYITNIGEAIGLDFQFDRIIVANTQLAHRLLKQSIQYGVQNEVGERLFHAYFGLGKNLDSIPELIKIASSAGLSATDTENILSSRLFDNEIEANITEARSLGIRAVPHFVFDNKYVVSGAQDLTIFQNTIKKCIETSTSS